MKNFSFSTIFKVKYGPNNIEVFDHVVREKSCTLVAKAFYMAQSSVTKKIKVLEKVLNQVLLERHTKKVELIPAGKKFFKITERSVNITSIVN